MPASYLIYHPKRVQTTIGDITVYHDSFGGNEDPYLWNKNFLHTFCHITQLSNEPGQINFWVSGDTYPNFERLYCDCVFVIEGKFYWETANSIDAYDPIVDTENTFEHHYKWVNPPHNHHPFKKRRRYTLKADAEKSFQPQDRNRKLIDILPFLTDNGISNDRLIAGMTSRMGSRPYKLESNVGELLYKYLYDTASIKLLGKDLTGKHPKLNVIDNKCC